MEYELKPDPIDHMMSVETVILEGLDSAVYKGIITEDEKHEWLNSYIDRRNATRKSLLEQIIEACE